MRLALYQPDIPQNTGTILRLAACFDIPVDIIGPAGFDMSDRSLRRAGLDYLQHVDLTRHEGWAAFERVRAPHTRLILLTTKARISHVEFSFRSDDTLVLGRESAGVPEAVHATADAAIQIPMKPGLRSLNVAIAAAIVVSEAQRQLGGFATQE